MAQRYADAGGDSYNGMNEQKFFQLREDIAATVPFLVGDINVDGHVDMSDLLLFAGSWGAVVGNPAYDPAADFNGDGAVDVVDLLILARNWGK